MIIVDRRAYPQMGRMLTKGGYRAICYDPDKEEKWECNKCDQSFRAYKRLREHKREEHSYE